MADVGRVAAQPTRTREFCIGNRVRACGIHPTIPFLFYVQTTQVGLGCVYNTARLVRRTDTS